MKMGARVGRRWAWSLGLSLALAIGTSSAASAAEQDENQNSPLKAAAVAAQKKDCKTALEIVGTETGKPGFDRRSDEIRIYFYQIGMACAFDRKEMDLAARYAEAATRIPRAPLPVWQARLALAWQAGKIADTVATVEDMARVNSEALNAMPSEGMFSLYRVVRKEKDENLRRRLLAVLTSPGYAPPEPGMSTDTFRKEYAVILAEAGDNPAATALVTQIESPTTLMSISLDPRLRGMVPAQFDARAAVERHMARLREIAAAHAGVIRPQLYVAQDLALLGKPEDALAVLDAIQPGKPGSPSYADQEDQLNWWWDARARAYSMLGRYDDAATAFTQGKSIAEQGQPNISQTINLAAAQLRFGRFKDSLETLAPIVAGKVKGSPYGMMQFRSVHGCASFLTGKTDDAQADLAYMREHADDAPAALTEMQLCVGDMDGAAASIIKRLDTPDQRVEALIELSDYASPPPSYPRYPTEAALFALKAREEVKAAIARAGGVRSFNVLQPPT